MRHVTFPAITNNRSLCASGSSSGDVNAGELLELDLQLTQLKNIKLKAH